VAATVTRVFRCLRHGIALFLPSVPRLIQHELLWCDLPNELRSDSQVRVFYKSASTRSRSVVLCWIKRSRILLGKDGTSEVMTGKLSAGVFDVDKQQAPPQV
jgi:hypothetical protein